MRKQGDKPKVFVECLSCSGQVCQLRSVFFCCSFFSQWIVGDRGFWYVWTGASRLLRNLSCLLNSRRFDILCLYPWRSSDSSFFPLILKYTSSRWMFPINQDRNLFTSPFFLKFWSNVSPGRILRTGLFLFHCVHLGVLLFLWSSFLFYSWSMLLLWFLLDTFCARKHRLARTISNIYCIYISVCSQTYCDACLLSQQIFLFYSLGIECSWDNHLFF